MLLLIQKGMAVVMRSFQEKNIPVVISVFFPSGNIQTIAKVMHMFESIRERLKKQGELCDLKLCGQETALSASSVPSGKGWISKCCPR